MKTNSPCIPASSPPAPRPSVRHRPHPTPLRGVWAERAAVLGFDAKVLVTEAGARSIESPEKEQTSAGIGGEDSASAKDRQYDLFELADRAVADERETIGLMRAGHARGRAAMRGWVIDRHLRNGPLTAGQRGGAVKLILGAKDRVVGVQGYAGVGKTRMLGRARALAEKKGWRMMGLAPSASAARTLAAESGIESETLQRFLARNAGVAEGRLTRQGEKDMRAAFARKILAVDEGSLASTV